MLLLLLGGTSAPAFYPGHIHIGKFIDADPLYTLENEIVSQDAIDDGSQLSNVIMVDGMVDSWTEYDRTNLIARRTALPAYFDLPELKTAGAVRQRGAEEVQQSRSVISPGGDVVGQAVLFTSRMDPIYWIDADGGRYQTRIEGKSVEFSQRVTPAQRATIDTGAVILCPPDTGDVTYIARDDFERETDSGLGDALTGGAWVTYT